MKDEKRAVLSVKPHLRVSIFVSAILLYHIGKINFSTFLDFARNKSFEIKKLHLIHEVQLVGKKVEVVRMCFLGFPKGMWWSGPLQGVLQPGEVD